MHNHDATSHSRGELGCYSDGTSTSMSDKGIHDKTLIDSLTEVGTDFYLSLDETIRVAKYVQCRRLPKSLNPSYATGVIIKMASCLSDTNSFQILLGSKLWLTDQLPIIQEDWLHAVRNAWQQALVSCSLVPFRDIFHVPYMPCRWLVAQLSLKTCHLIH